MAAQDDLILAMDIGGTKIAAGLVDRDSQIHSRQETPTLAQEGRAGILSRVEMVGKAVLSSAAQGSVRAVGIASAGQIDLRTGRVNYATDNLPGWNRLEITREVERLFGLPATAENDVNAMAVAEMHLGAGRGYQEVFCAMVGTGIGGAIIQHGELYTGILGGAGELGHLSIQAFGGRPCNCGGTGCVEVYGSSRAVLADFIQAAGSDAIQRRLGIAAQALTIQDLGRAFQDPANRDWDALHRIIAGGADALGAALAAAANLLSPELIVVAGSILLLGDDFLDIVRGSLQRRAMVPRQSTLVLPSQLGADPGLVGAALLARQRLLR